MESSRNNSTGTENDPDRKILSQRLKYLLLSDQDADHLRAMKTTFISVSDEFIDDFYSHLKSFPEVNQFLDVPGLVERLKEKQKKHLISMFDARWDEEYVRNREKVGHAHSATGVEPDLVLGGFYQYVRLGLFEILKSSTDEEVISELYPKINALLKVIFLDVGLTLDSYFKQSTLDIEKALEMLWRTNTELKQFAQLASHDLKTPLATVSNICEEILDEYKDEMPGDSAELVSVARQTVLNMNGAINELLSATAKLSLDPEDILETVDTNLIVQSVIERLETSASQKKISITIEENLPRLVANDVFLKEVLVNLISNAIKYIDKTPGEIHIRSYSEHNEGILVVQDNGPGIPTENLSQIFSPFKRLNQHQAIPGSGLGLYYSRYLVEKQGGRIWAASEPGTGSQFYIALPAARQ